MKRRLARWTYDKEVLLMRYMVHILVLALALSFMSNVTIAQETQHPGPGQFDPYLGLLDKQGESCCHNQHCRPAQYQNRGTRGHWMSIDRGKTWFQVPRDKEVLPTPNVRALGGATWCGTVSMMDGLHTMCWTRKTEEPSV